MVDSLYCKIASKHSAIMLHVRYVALSKSDNNVCNKFIQTKYFFILMFLQFTIKLGK